MAVENKYTDSNVVNNIPAVAYKTAGQWCSMFWETFEIAAADSANSIYRFFKSLPANLIPLRIEVACDEIAGCTDNDIGLYATDLGAVKVADCLMDGQTFAVASDYGLNGMAKQAIESRNKRLWELAGDTDGKYPSSYDMALIMKATAGNAGTVCVRMFAVQG